LSLRVHFAESLTAEESARLAALLVPGVTLTTGETPPAVDFEVLVTGRPTAELLAASRALRAVVVPWAGVPKKTRELLLAYPHIALHNLHHNAAATAEMAITLLLAAAKRLIPLDRALRAGDWRPRYADATSLELSGKTALVLGFGAIGRHVARVCLALGMAVIATRRRAGDGEQKGEFEIHPPAALRALLPRADVLFVCLPLTPETAGLLGAAELALLPARAILVNVGRGPIVDEEALYAALASGRIAAAGLDVWYSYPEDEAARESTLPSRFPFHELDSVVLSPHRAGDNVETERERMPALAALLNAAARGEPMPNRVDLAAGY
jgi:phosphoglycerate dehydrogenase-like enzyme